MVLFLFVIMLLGTEKLPRSSAMPWQKYAAIGLSILLLIEAGLLIYEQAVKPSGWPEMVESVTSPTEIGLSLFNQYLLPFEITSFILLAAVIGAIYLTRPERIHKKGGRSEE